MMPNIQRKFIARRMLRAGLRRLSRHDRHRLSLILRRLRIARDIQLEFEGSLTFGEKLADRVALFGGSWTFIIIFAVVLMAWVSTNSLFLGSGAFDPYPYIFLNLVLSMIAAIQAPIIMMSQNRQSAKDRLAVSHDYEVNLKAELEIMALHEKLDAMRTSQLEEILRKQADQIELLTQLLTKSRASGS